jgi:dinuclear metal center YbgI/SA1388 family protein
MYVSREEFLEFMEEYAPLRYALDFDNPGMLIDLGAKEYRRVLLALDARLEVIEEAERIGADLVMTHHPLMFQPVKRLGDTGETRAILRLARCGASLFAAHTNLDCAKKGTNATLCDLLELQDHRSIDPIDGDDSVGIVRMGFLAEEMTLADFARKVRDTLDAPGTCLSGEETHPVRKIAVCTGSGMSCLRQALGAGADVLLSGEMKLHEAQMAAEEGIGAVCAGHYETEKPAMKRLLACLQERFDGVQYNTEFILTKTERPAIRMA